MRNLRPKNKTLNLDNLRRISGAYACQYAFCSADLHNITLGLSGIPNNSDYMFQYAFANCGNLTSVSFPRMAGISTTNAFQYAFQGCSKLSSMTFPALRTIGSGSTNYNHIFNFAFHNTPKLSCVEFPELTAVLTVCQNVFHKTLHTDVNGANTWPTVEVRFPKLVTFRQGEVDGPPFYEFSGNQTTAAKRRKCKLYLDSVKSLTGGAASARVIFYNSRGMTDIYLPSLTAITNNYIFQSCFELTGIHFGKENESLIRATANWSTQWGRGAGGATIFFEDWTIKKQFIDWTESKFLKVNRRLRSVDLESNGDIVQTIEIGHDVLMDSSQECMNLFFNMPNLYSITIHKNIPIDIDELVLHWKVGISGETYDEKHMVIMYFDDGIVVVNDNSDSSGMIDSSIMTDSSMMEADVLNDDS